MSESLGSAEIGVDETPVVRPGSAAGMTTRVARGMLWSLGGQCAVIVGVLAATPFTIRLLGPEAYGVLALVNVLIGYLAFTDMGMGLTATRFGAAAHSRLDDRGEVAVVWTSTVIAIVPAALSALVLALFAAPLVDEVLRLSAELRSESIIVLRLAALGFIARSASGVLNAPQLVRLRMDLNTTVTAAIGIGQSCLVPIVLFLGGGLVGAATVISGISIGAVFVHLVISQRLLPPLFKPRIDPALVRPLMRFGIGLVGSTIAAMVLVNIEKMFLPRFASVTALAHYAVAYSVAGMLAVVPGALRQTLLPAFSRLHAERDTDSLARLYGRALRGNLLWIAPASVLLCVAAKPFFTLWAGPEFGQQSTVPFYILVGGLLFNVMAYIPYTLLMAFGRSDLIARFHLAELLPYVVVAAVLTYWLGVIGAAIAWSLRVALDSLLFFIAARRVAGLRFSPVPVKQGVYAIAAGALLPPLLLLFNEAASHLALLSCVTVLSLVTYGCLVWRRVLSAEERAWVAHSLHWQRQVDVGM